FTHVSVYQCDDCFDRVLESDRHYASDNTHYCTECAFKKDLINSKFYLESIGLCGDMFRAKLKPNGAVGVWRGINIAPWERQGDVIRNTSEYRAWRQSVLKRDSHTCKECSSKDELHAHHIIPISVNIELALTPSNGITLCGDCHRDVHRKKE